MMITDNNSASSMYNLEGNTIDKRVTESDPKICVNRPSSPRKFFERLYGHLEKENPKPRCDELSTETGSHSVDPIRSPSVSSDSTSRSSPTLDIEEMDTLYSDSVQFSDTYDQRSYSGYTSTLPIGQASFGQQGLVPVQPLRPLAGGYGGTFRPFFGLGPDGSHIPAGLSAFRKYWFLE